MVESGFPFYGQNIGILVFNGTAPRVPGDAGHAATFPFPVCYEIVSGSFAAIARKDPAMKANLLEAVQRLKAKGIKAVAGDCGLMSLYQKEMAQEGVLVAASSLCQIPMLWQLLGHKGSIGVLTGDSRLLGEEYFTASGCADIPVFIKGMEHGKNFREVVLEGGTNLQPRQVEAEVIAAGQELMAEHPEVRAFVLECSNLATYAKALSVSTRLPVFDIVSAIRFLAYGFNPYSYPL